MNGSLTPLNEILEASLNDNCSFHVKFSGVVYQIKQVTLADGLCVYPLWLSRDPEDPGEEGRSYANLTFASSFNSTFDKSMLNDQMPGAVSSLYCVVWSTEQNFAHPDSLILQ